MSEDADEGEAPEDPGASPGTARPDEPLGDLAARVRERTGERDPAERPKPTSREGPLADVASEVDERRRRKREETDVFESVDVGELDGEKLWEQLAEGEADATGPSVPVEEAPEVEWDDEDEWESDADEWEDDGRDVRTIPKETCHGCPHLGDPPDLACTHEGTDILAMPDSDHFRVADCPMVVDEEEIRTFETEDGDSGDEDGGLDGDDLDGEENADLGDDAGLDDTDLDDTADPGDDAAPGDENRADPGGDPDAAPGDEDETTDPDDQSEGGFDFGTPDPEDAAE